jgi:hypothetical protein
MAGMLSSATDSRCLAAADVSARTLADMAYIGAGDWVTTAKRRPPNGELTPTERTRNRALSAARAPVERGMARLKSWHILRRSRISPNRMSVIAKAVLTLERKISKRSVILGHSCSIGRLVVPWIAE